MIVLTKLGHACVRLEKDGRRLVIDPGVLSDPDALDGADAVLVTHEHPDHVAPDRLRAAVERDADLVVRAPGAVVELLGGAGPQLQVATPGERFAVAGVDVEVLGGRHAEIHPDIPRVANAAYLLDGVLLHPGDSLTLPPGELDTLLLPVSAPWLKLAEVIDYVRAVAPRRALRIHDGVYAPFGHAVVNRQLGPDGVGIGRTEYVPWSDGDVVTLA